MADVTIQNSSGVTFTFQQGEVDKVRSQVIADIEQTALPASGPSQAFLFDFEGVRKLITITGSLFDADTTRTSSGTTKTILEQKQWLEQNLNGSQSAVTFSSTYEAQTYDGSAYQNTKVMWGSIEFEEIAGETEELPFVATILVGS